MNNIEIRISAAFELAKRYPKIKEKITDDLINECMDVISNKNTTKEQKKASKVILVIKYGKIKANNLIEDIAIVINRNDSLVRRWRKKVIERDKKCVKCGSVKHLNAHHISHWSYDPINRVNVNNGVTLCKNCHALEHPEIDKLIKSGGST